MHTLNKPVLSGASCSAPALTRKRLPRIGPHPWLRLSRCCMKRANSSAAVSERKWKPSLRKFRWKSASYLPKMLVGPNCHSFRIAGFDIEAFSQSLPSDNKSAVSRMPSARDIPVFSRWPLSGLEWSCMCRSGGSDRDATDR